MRDADDEVGELIVVREDVIGERIWAEERPGTFVTEICPCSGAVVDPGATTEGFASFGDSSAGVTAVVIGTPSAVNVV